MLLFKCMVRWKVPGHMSTSHAEEGVEGVSSYTYTHAHTFS